MATPEQLAGLEKARQNRSNRAAERALQDPIKLRFAARVFRHALRRGLVDADGNVLTAEDLKGNGEVGASAGFNGA